MPRSVLARQHDRVVREIEHDFLKRKIRELDLFRINDVAVAVVASERRGVVVFHRQFPMLEFLRRDALFVTLRQGDLVDKPISPRRRPPHVRPVGKKHVAHQSMPIPILAARELRQVGFGQCFVVVMVFPFLFVGRVASADATLAFAENGVASRKENLRELVRAQPKASHGRADCPWGAPRGWPLSREGRVGGHIRRVRDCHPSGRRRKAASGARA